MSEEWDRKEIEAHLKTVSEKCSNVFGLSLNKYHSSWEIKGVIFHPNLGPLVVIDVAPETAENFWTFISVDALNEATEEAMLSIAPVQ